MGGLVFDIVNEIYILVGEFVVIELKSVDVIYVFWVL